jgi:hypothetical protein
MMLNIRGMKMIWAAMLLLLGHQASAAVIASVADSAVASDTNYVLGMTPMDLGYWGGEADVYFMTVGQLYAFRPYAAAGDINIQLRVSPFDVGFKLNTLTQIAPAPHAGPYNDTIFVNSIRNSFYRYSVPDNLYTATSLQFGFTGNRTMVSDSTDLYQLTNPTQIYRIDTSSGTGALVTDFTAYAGPASTFAIGVNRDFYVLAQAVAPVGSANVGDWCIFDIGIDTGSLLSNFALPFDASNARITTDPAGRIYFAMGNGQGYIYDRLGDPLATLSSSAINPLPFGGNTIITTDPDGYIYMMDAATGLHVFSPIPEPSTFGVTTALLGVAATTLSRRR